MGKNQGEVDMEREEDETSVIKKNDNI